MPRLYLTDARMNSCLAHSEDLSLLFAHIIKGEMVLAFLPCVALVVSKL